MKQVSLKSIAKELGISVATVSIVLSGKTKEGRVSNEMAQKIIDCAKRMNYQPNRIARSLRIGKSNTIGLVVADISNVFFSTLAFHVQEEAEKHGFSVVITNTNESDSKMEEAINILRGHQVDGFIIVPTENGEDSIQKLINDNVPFVLVDRYYPSIESSYVTVDSYSISLKAVKMLVEKGSKKIAFLTYKNNMPHMQARKNGYVDALTSAGLLDESLIKEIRYTHIQEDIEQSLSELFDGNKHIDALFCSTNSISLIALKNIINRGMQITKGIDVICFDRSEVYDFMHTPHIQQPVEEMGEMAVNILLSKIEKKSNETVNISLQAQLLNS